MTQVWKDIEGFDGYSLSRRGDVLSTMGATPKLLKHNKRGNYFGVRLFKNKKMYRFSIHRLLAETFIPNPDNKPEVNHVNGIKTDNRVENLEWVTKSENQKHALKMGLANIGYGEKSRNRKLNNLQVRVINRLKGYLSQRIIAGYFGIAQTRVSQIHLGKHKFGG